MIARIAVVLRREEVALLVDPCRPAHPGLTLLVYTAPRPSPAADSLKLLATWAATLDAADRCKDSVPRNRYSAP